MATIWTNVSLYLSESANRYPDASALVCDDTKTSYSALGNDVARFADYLTYGGLQPGDRVGVMLPNGPEFAVVFYGVTPRAVRSMTIGTSGMA